MNWSDLIHNNFFIKLLAAIVELLIGFSLGPVIKRAIMHLHNQRGVDEGVLTFTGSLANISIRMIAIIIALGQIGVDMSVAVGAFSAIGLGISLALKENMSNVASGMQILITRPFRVGDYIAVTDMEGTVTAIEIMFTTMKTFDNQQVVIPNTVLVSNPITNYSLYPSRRIVLNIPINFQDEYDTFRSQAQNLMETTPSILQDPKPKTVVAGYTADGKAVSIKLVCYTRLETYWDTLYKLQDEVEALRKKTALIPPASYIKVVSS